jgi:hypothetical protein
MSEAAAALLSSPRAIPKLRDAPLPTIGGPVRRGGLTPPCGVGASARVAKRRAYNRRYMQRWRERNGESVQIDNGEQGKVAAQCRRGPKARVKKTPRQRKCAYGCRRPAVTTIERIDPGTWNTISVPYCGFC